MIVFSAALRSVAWPSARKRVRTSFRASGVTGLLMKSCTPQRMASRRVCWLGAVVEQAIKRTAGRNLSKMRTESKKRIRIPAQIEKYDVGNSFARIRQLFHRNRSTA